MVAEPQFRFMTAREFSKLPETTTPMELIDGELIVSPTPTPHHQIIADRLTHPLVEIERRKRSGRWLSSPVDLYMSPNNVFQPDASFFVNEHMPDMHRLPITEIPAIVIEVLSPSSRSRDQVRKRAGCSDRGIPEYWIVDPVRRRIVFNLADSEGNYTGHELNGVIIPVGRYAGVELDLDWIFED